jgi:hypothetical protein
MSYFVIILYNYFRKQQYIVATFVTKAHLKLGRVDTGVPISAIQYSKFWYGKAISGWLPPIVI